MTRGQFRAFVNESGYKTDAEKGGLQLIFTGTGCRAEIVNV
jgi:hypothetical protein